MTHYSSSIVDTAVSELLTEIQTNNGESIEGINGILAAALKQKDIKQSIELFIIRSNAKRYSNKYRNK